jgi:hypothetical protein
MFKSRMIDVHGVVLEAEGYCVKVKAARYLSEPIIHIISLGRRDLWTDPSPACLR